MFERLDLMERKGSGFKKLYEDYETLSVNLGKRMPVLESFSTYFRVILPNLIYGFTDEQLALAVSSVPPVMPPVMPPVVPPVVTPVKTPVVTPVMTPVGKPSETLIDAVQRKVLVALKGGTSCPLLN